MELQKLGALKFKKALKVANKKHLENYNWFDIAIAIDAVETKNNQNCWKDWEEIKIVKKIEELDILMNSASSS